MARTSESLRRVLKDDSSGRSSRSRKIPHNGNGATTVKRMPVSTAAKITALTEDLGSQRPVDVIRAGRIQDLLAVIADERAGGYV